MCIPGGYPSGAQGITVKKFLKINTGILKTTCLPPKWKVSPLSRGVIMLGNVPSQYIRKFVPGFYKRDYYG
jgi:hypothetical protein